MNNDQDINDENPWPGLESYNESASKWFYGREEEVDTLLRLIERETLSVLYGRSGMGKTSLIQAGLFPRLREIDYLPVRLRLVLADDAGSLRVQIGEAIARECKKYSIQARPYDGTVSLWEYFFQKGGEFWSVNDHLIIPVLVFDQFEEFFTFGRENAKRRERCEFLMAEIGDLVENRRPVALRAQIEGDESIASHFDSRRPPPKILFSFREDYLADFDILSNYLHAGTVNRMRLLPMMGDKAQAAIVAVSPKHVSSEVAVEIVRFVAADQQSQSRPLAELPVEPFLLSLICRELNLRRQASGLQHIAVDLLADTQIEILNNFYTRCLKDSPPALVKFIEEKLISEDGKHRINVVLADATRLPKVRRDSIDTLVDRRLLRVEKRSGTERMELIHDVLTLVAMNSRNARHRREYLKKFGSVLLGMLVIMSVLIFQLLEIRQERDKAEVERGRANWAEFDAKWSEGIAKVARDKAKKAEGEAKDARDDAKKKEGIAKDERNKATSRMLAIQANEILDEKTDRPLAQGVLFAVEAYRLSKEPLTRDVLMKARQKTVIPYAELPKVEGAMFSPMIFNQDGKLLALGFSDGYRKIHLWDMAERKPIGESLLVDSSPISLFNKVLALDPGGKTLASAWGMNADEKNNDGVIQLWDMVEGKQKDFLPRDRQTRRVAALAFSWDGKTLAELSEDGTIQLWNVAKRKPKGDPLHSDGGKVYSYSSLAFNKDGTILAEGHDQVIRLWDVGEGKPLGEFRSNGTHSLAFSWDGKTLASGGGYYHPIQLWDVVSRRPKGEVTGADLNREAIQFLAFSPDGMTLASNSRNKPIRLWDLARVSPSYQSMFANTKPFAFAMSLDGKTLALGGKNETGNVAVQLWDVDKRKPKSEPLLGHGMTFPYSLACSPDTNTLAVGGAGGVIQLWDMDKKKPKDEPLRGNDGKQTIHQIAFSLDGKTLAAGSADGTIQLWDMGKRKPKGEPLHRQKQQIRSLCFSPEGKTLASGSFDNTIQLWDVAKGKPVGEPLLGHDRKPIYPIAFTPDGKTLASRNENGTIQLWDVASAKPKTMPKGWTMRWLDQRGQNNSSLDGKTLAFGSDKGIILWDVASRRLMDTSLMNSSWLSGAGRVVAFSSDGKALLAIDASSFNVWDLDFDAWPAILCNQVQRNLTKDEWNESIGDLMLYHKTCPDLPEGN